MQINKDILINHTNIEFNPKENSWVASLVDKMFNILPKEEKSGESKTNSYIYIDKRKKEVL